MRKVLFMFVFSIAAHAYAWGPLAHNYIAQKATGSNHPDVLYGSILVDMNQAVFGNPEAAAVVRRLTHYEYYRLTESCLALGFTTHNEVWGADRYAHQYFLEDVPESEWYYATDRILYLATLFDLAPVEAEFIFEFAVEMLLYDDLGTEPGLDLFFSASAFGLEQMGLLLDAYETPLHNSISGMSQSQARRVLSDAAFFFRMMNIAYGWVFTNDANTVREAMKWFTSFYLGLDANWASFYLGYAMEICRHDYLDELDRIAEAVREGLEEQYPSLTDACVWDCAFSQHSTRSASMDMVSIIAATGILAMHALYHNRKRIHKKR